MRLWTIHPKYLDTKGLVAVWREGLLAQKVLQDQTTGYRHHPQLRRFRASADPVGAIGAYLQSICLEAFQRGYQFRAEKIVRTDFTGELPCTRGQLIYEWKHLREKLRGRDGSRYREIEHVEEPEQHPLFYIIEGDVEAWEVGAGNRVNDN
jgi:hypothetical protein